MYEPFKHRSNTQNFASMRHTYHIAAPKPPGRTFATHEDISGKPRFGTDGWFKLSDGGSRDSHLERYLAIEDDATVVICIAGTTVQRKVRKGAIVLAEALPDRTWKISIPRPGDAIGDSEDTDPPAGDGDPLARTHPAGAADTA